MSNRDFELVKVNVRRDVRLIDYHNFSCWYAEDTGRAFFKINEVHRKVLEKHLYIVG